MQNVIANKVLAKVISIGAFLTTTFLWMSGVTDPVNATKLTILGGTAIASLGVLAVHYRKVLLQEFPILLGIILFFVVAMSNAVINSHSPLVQNFYGVFGRNTGFLAYFMLAALLLGTAVIDNRKNLLWILISLIAAGLVNVVYSAWVLLFKDPLNWDNPYGRILGTFGNPNFISAFLGIIFSIFVVIALAPGLSKKLRIFAFLLCPLILLEIKTSNSVQGLIVSGVGFGFALFFYVHFRLKNWIVTSAFGTSLIATFTLVGLGTLQVGPLSFLYKKSISLRATYWETALEIGKGNPLTGVGMDSYIDSYRRFRPDRALVDTPGVNVTSNSAHNIFLDLFASGGFPLGIAYLLLVGVGIYFIAGQILRKEEFDWLFVSLAVAWIGYQVQSLVSINQIGLAVWGWILTGSLVAYSRIQKNNALQSEKNSKGKQSVGAISPQLVAGVSIVIGTLVASPPLASDTKWFNAILTKSYSNFETSLTPGFYNPQNSNKYGMAINLLQGSGLIDQSYYFAKEAVRFNPEYFEAWKQLYFQPKATQEDRDLALKKMKLLDPLNPNVISNE
jgi:O-antigen ligase